MKLRSGDINQALDLIWDVLGDYRENNIPEGVYQYDRQWEDICTAMAWIEESLGFEGYNEDGDRI